MAPTDTAHPDLRLALDAVTAAARITRHVQAELAAIRQHSKDDRSPVTVADYAAQAVIAARLASSRSSTLLVGEEDATALRSPAQGELRKAVTQAVQVAWPGAGTDDVLDAIDEGNHDATANRYWTLDPIDGTKGFLRGGQYAISLALIANGEVEFGVLGCPNLSADHDRPFDDPDPVGCTFHAVRGGGSWVRAGDDAHAAASPIAVSTRSEPHDLRVCESVEAAHSRIDETTRILEYLGGHGDSARLDSQCKYAVVARGQADAYLRLPTQRSYIEKIWDHAAGKLIAEEAGAEVSDVRGAALDFSHGAGLHANRGIICATPAYQPRLLQAIEALDLFPD